MYLNLLTFSQVGVRTDGLQEALLKNPGLVESADRITKMKRVIKAVSNLSVSGNK